MPQKPFVMRVHFYLSEGSGRHSLQSGAHHVEYMGSREKEELLLDAAPAHDDTTLDSAAIHAKYARERDGSLGYLGSLAHDPHDPSGLSSWRIHYLSVLIHTVAFLAIRQY
ncbi:MAG: hypothetical protein M1499_06475 [Firmicutes bacterium]|nr:hypothetical protein [Bacillota bacterium]MCL5972189.1 hypothetical protein [Bacillota bacterium]